MVNNVDQIKPLLKFPTTNHFYFLEVIKRRKENPEMEKGTKLIKDFFVYSLEEFDKVVEKMIELCDLHNARAYIRLNVRNAEKIAFKYNQRLAETLTNGEWKSIPNLYSSVVGKHQAEEKGEKTWIIDLDDEQAKPEFYTKVLNVVTGLNPEAVVALIETKNGLHVVCKPFRRDKFEEIYKGTIDIHPDNPTILYVP
jgi:hypothetical protein